MKNANVKGFGKVLSAMALAALLLLTCLLPRASARAIDNPADDDPYEKLYYFSDYDQCLNFRNGVLYSYIGNSGLTAADVVLNYWPYVSETNNFWTQFSSFILTTQLTQLGKSFIIFEIRDGFRKGIAPDSVAGDIALLEDMFSTLKGQGCRIMFICGTDETILNEYYDFLLFVDIHIKTDIITSYVDNALRIMEATFQEEYVSSCAILLNSNASSIIEEYLIPYFRYWGNLSALEYPEYQQPQAFLGWCSQNLGIEIFVGSGNSYTNQASGAAVSYEQILTDHARIFALEVLWSSEDVLELNDLFDLQEDQERYFPVFVFNASWSSLGSYGDSYILYVSDDGKYVLSVEILDIIGDFFLDHSLTGYTNWNGRCPATYKPILFGPNGWILGCRVWDPCWQASMFEEDWEFYFGEYVSP